MTRRKSLRGAAAPASVSEAGEPMEEDTANGEEVQEEETPELTTGSGDATTPREGSPMNVDEQGPEEERAEREQQLWEAFRDEYYESAFRGPLATQCVLTTSLCSHRANAAAPTAPVHPDEGAGTASSLCVVLISFEVAC